MTPDKCLTDILAVELEPELAPLMRKVGFKPVDPAQLSPTDAYFLQERDKMLLNGRSDFRKPEDALIYQNSGGLLLQVRRGARDPYLGVSFRPRIFALAYKYDLEAHPTMGTEHADRLLPPADQFGKLSMELRKALAEDYILLARASEGNSPFLCNMNMHSELTTLHTRKFARDFPGMPPDLKPSQLYFNLWLEFGDSIVPYEGRPKAEALAKMSTTIATVTNIIQIYVPSQINAYESQAKSNKVLDVALESAAVLPARIGR